MRYFLKFLKDNKNKSFFTNLKKYSKLNYFEKCKVISSFLTHLFIHREGLENKREIEMNDKYIVELVSLLNNIVLYKDDKFYRWFLRNLKDGNSKYNKEKE